MRRIDQDNQPQVTIEFEGKLLAARRGDSVASALLEADQWTFRTTPVNGEARGPFCMMGVCFDCLVEIDGVANCQACMMEVRDGMSIKRQQGAGDIRLPLPNGDKKGDAP